MNFSSITVPTGLLDNAHLSLACSTPNSLEHRPVSRRVHLAVRLCVLLFVVVAVVSKVGGEVLMALSEGLEGVGSIVRLRTAILKFRGVGLTLPSFQVHRAGQTSLLPPLPLWAARSRLFVFVVSRVRRLSLSCSHSRCVSLSLTEFLSSLSSFCIFHEHSLLLCYNQTRYSPIVLTLNLTLQSLPIPIFSLDFLTFSCLFLSSNRTLSSSCPPEFSMYLRPM